MSEEMQEHFGSHLRGIRKSKGLSLDDLANESKISRAYIWKLEMGKSNPSLSVVMRLANALGVRLWGPVGQGRLVFCAVCGMRWYRAGDYRGEVCLECYCWGRREQFRWLPEDAKRAVYRGGTAIVQHNGTVQWMDGGYVWERRPE